MLVTQSPEIAQKARYLSTQARDDALEYLHEEVGYNYRLTGLQAALGLAQLEQLEGFIERKRAIARMYKKELSGIGGITCMPTPRDTEATYWLYTVLLKAGTTLAQRRSVIEKLHQLGVGARPLWAPVHSLKPYRGCQAIEIEHASRLYERAVSLPSSPGLTDRQLERCIETFKQVLTQSEGVG